LINDFLENLTEKERWIWFSAFFEGEGTIMETFDQLLIVQAGEDSRILLENINKHLLKNRGTICKQSKEVFNKSFKRNNYTNMKATKNAYFLSIGKRDLTYYVLKNITPFLYNKREQARLAIFYHDIRKKYSGYTQMFKRFTKDCREIRKRMIHNLTGDTNFESLESKHFGGTVIHSLGEFY